MSGNLLDPDNQNGHRAAHPAPEGVNLLGTSERVAANTDATRNNYAIGPFGQAWLWTISIILVITSLWKVIVGPLLATTLPTTTGTVLGWITVPARTVTYLPKVRYEVGGRTYEFIAGNSVGTLTNAPTSVTVSYVPFAPANALWNTGEWWSSFFDIYLMVMLLLGLILFFVAIYQWRIRGYWKRKTSLSPQGYSRLTWIGLAVAVAGAAWSISGYVSPASWYIPPEPNVLAAFVTAIGVAMLTSGRYNRKHVPDWQRGLDSLTPEQRAAYDAAVAHAKAGFRAKGMGKGES